MKIKIEYEYDPRWGRYAYYAKSELDGRTVMVCGDSWTDARNNLLKRVIELKNEVIPTVPEPEEVQI